jgi:predicted dehydrogenase
VCDPSRSARAFIAERYSLATFESVEQLLHQPLDAVVVASPDPLHREHVLKAFDHRLHVLCEKPLCYSSRDIDELIAARDRAGRVLQTGYMKRFDPSYEAALDLLPKTASTLRHVSVEVSDPDAWPFVRHHDWRKGEDLPRALVEEVAAKQEAQVARAIGEDADETTFRGFCAAYSSALVHDVNAVHGLLERMGVAAGEIVGADLYAGGDGGHGSVRLLGGRALWTMTHLTVPRLPDYRERITLYFDDAAIELEFPSPWLNHQPTRLTVRRASKHRLHVEDIRTGYAEAFVEELKGFADGVAQGRTLRNSAEEARRDMDLICGLARFRTSHLSPSPPAPRKIYATTVPGGASA